MISLLRRTCSRYPRIRLRSVMLAVVLLAFPMALLAHMQRAAIREDRLWRMIRAERARAQGYSRLARLAILNREPTDPADRALRDELIEESDRFEREAYRLRTGRELQGFMERQTR